MSRILAALLAASLGFAISGLVFRPDRPERTPADALADAWKQVSASPQSAEAWVRLGELQASLDQSKAAERSYRTAIALGDPTGMAQGRLGFLLYGQHRDREALELLVSAREAGSQLPIQDFTIRELERRLVELTPAEPIRQPASSEPSTPPAAPERPPLQLSSPIPVSSPAPPLSEPNSCRVPLRQVAKGSTYLIDVVMDGVESELIVDTGASLTVITRALADDIGLRLDFKMTLSAVTANGPVEFPTAVLDEVVLSDQVVNELRVAVCEGCVEAVADGLFGLDLQSAYGMRLDLGAGQAELADCR
ncbi:MAG: aspartyl protease family protein [Myxococcota bacterium]